MRFLLLTDDDIQGDHSACAKPPVDLKTKVPLGLVCPGLAWSALAWPGQSETFALNSTGGFAQAEWSPCTIVYRVDGTWGMYE